MLVVVNPAARGDAGGSVDEIVHACRGAGREAATLVPDGPQRAVEAIRRAVTDDGPWEAVLAVGGDGTVATCAEALSATAAPLLIVPAGTGNSMYRALWEDRPWPEVLSSVFAGGARIRDVDLLEVSGDDSGTGAVSVLGASAGLIAEVVALSSGSGGVTGRERYSAAIGPALESHVPFPARVTVDGPVLLEGPVLFEGAVLFEGPVSLVAVGGARHRSGTFQLLARSVLDDGLADVCVVGGVDGAGFVELAAAVIDGTHLGHELVRYGQGTVVRIERTDGRPLVFEHDGDLWPAEDRCVEVTVRGSVRVFAPVVPVAG